MGLTRLRAEQISDIDYKQAVRVITTTNIANLSGGTPSQVDGVSLSLKDRILVAAQNSGSENGLYLVETVGSGNDGTWIRTIDSNETGELEAGTIVMVTEGNSYADTQWKLTTNNPIVIGTTALTFEQNSAFAFGNIYANGTAVLASTVGDTVTLAPGPGIAVTGNNTTKIVTITATGSAETTAISNGTSTVSVTSSNGNVATTIGATANVIVVSTTGQYITGIVSVTGNVQGGNLRTAGQVSATGAITGASVVGGVMSGSSLSATGNITGGNILTSGDISASGNITGLNINSSNADLAEMYCADSKYNPGTVVEFGGLEEITISTQSHSTKVAGIISTHPSYLMNSTLDCTNALEVALTGRVPCRVTGTISKGDRLVASDLPGVATVLDLQKYNPGCIIGKALENYNSDSIGIIEVAVGRF